MATNFNQSFAHDVNQAFYVVVLQEGGSNPKPAQRMS